MQEYKDRRYSGLTGKARWLRDLFAGLPEEANQIYEQARDNYVAGCGRSSPTSPTPSPPSWPGQAAHRRRPRRSAGRGRANSRPTCRPSAAAAAGEFAGKFDELRESVDDKGTELVDTLATKYTDALKGVDDEIAAEKEKNKGLVDKAVDAVKGVIKTIMELKHLLLGVLAQGGGRDRRDSQGPDRVPRQPGRRRGRRPQALHEERRPPPATGILRWLLGTGRGRSPTARELRHPGILMMIATLLGLLGQHPRADRPQGPRPGRPRRRDRGPWSSEPSKAQGVAGLWNDLKARVGDLKKDLIGKLVEYLLPTVIIAGVTWIVSLLNPASAFIRACKMIIDIIRFIVTQARQIIEFVNSVLDAIIAIARGGSGGPCRRWWNAPWRIPSRC
jgi:hypothetical protein